MHRIVLEAETVANYPSHLTQVAITEELSHALSYAARQIVEHSPSVSAIVTFTQSGFTARIVSKDRPKVPILALTPHRSVYSKLALMWGVVPRLCGYIEDIEEMVAEVDRILLEEEYAKAGQTAVILGSLPIHARGTTNFLRLHRIGSSQPSLAT